jgi:hypothetical protein
VPDGWQQAASANVSGQQWTSIWYSSSVTGSPVTASAAITSAPWAAVLLGYKASPLQPLSAAPVPVAAALSASTIWADNGVFSCRVTKVGTAAQWGILFPPVGAQSNSPISMPAIVYKDNIALPARVWDSRSIPGRTAPAPTWARAITPPRTATSMPRSMSAGS